MSSHWAGDLETRKSTTGFLFIYSGAAISWNSKRQQTVALSSTEAEYMAGTSTTQEATYLRKVLKDLQETQMEPTTINMDNQGAITMAKDFMANRRTKHIEVKYHFIREKIEDKTIRVQYLPTEEMPADCLTKAVGPAILQRAKPIIFGVQNDNKIVKLVQMRESVEKHHPSSHNTEKIRSYSERSQVLPGNRRKKN